MAGVGSAFLGGDVGREGGALSLLSLLHFVSEIRKRSAYSDRMQFVALHASLTGFQ